MTWEESAAVWWVEEVATDRAYRQYVDPLLDVLLPQGANGDVLDLGCGDGRHAGRFTSTIGIDSSPQLASAAAVRMPVVIGDAVRLPFGNASLAGAYTVLVIEHVAEVEAFFAEVARVVAPDGWLVAVLNHPLWTAPGAGPFVDPDDGEILWRWGQYLARGLTDEPAGVTTVRFHHRALGDLLTTAATAGWSVTRLVERSVDPDDDPLLAAQSDVPRLLGVRWRRVVLHDEGASD